jgi:uncharacterized membrane protein YgcG
MKRSITFVVAAVFILSACTSTKTAQNISEKEIVDNDLYFKDVKLSEQQAYAAAASQSQVQSDVSNDGPLSRYYDPNDPAYYYSNRINKFYYPQSYNAYFDDFYNPYNPHSSWSLGMGTSWGMPYYGSSFYHPYMPSTYFSMTYGWGSPYYGYGYSPYGYGYGYAPYNYNYLGYYYNNPYYSGAYYPGYYVYNVAPGKAYSNYGPRDASGGTNINRPRTYRGNELGTSRPAWRPENSGVGRSEARPRTRTTTGERSTELSRPNYSAPRNEGGSRSSGGESRSSGSSGSGSGSESGSARPRSRN